MQTTIYINKANEEFWRQLENKSQAVNKWLSVVSGDSTVAGMQEALKKAVRADEASMRVMGVKEPFTDVYQPSSDVDLFLNATKGTNTSIARPPLLDKLSKEPIKVVPPRNKGYKFPPSAASQL